MKDETKTIREWLSELPEPIRSRAIKNAEDDPEFYSDGEDATSSVMCALAGAFVWRDTPEGHDYWSAIYNGETPELPDHLNEKQ